MARQPFVWEVHVRREMVEDELAHLRELPYSVWRSAVGLPRVKQIVGRDNRNYTLTVAADWARRGSEDIHVSVTLTGPGVGRSRVRQGFTISPDNRLA
jgi:hypothetical protein